MAQPRLLTRPATTLFSTGFRRTLVNSPTSITTTSPSRRTFLGASSLPLTLHASRTLPYAAADLYRLISDISSYPTFIPYCTSARVQTQSAPDPTTSTAWPASATLTVGYSSFSESFLSRVYCVPNTIVEAVSGSAVTSIPQSDIPHYQNLKFTANTSDSTENEMFESLRTRWSLKPYDYKPADRHPEVKSGKTHPSEVSVEGMGSEPRTDVDLMIEIRWKNPLYAAASQAVADGVAGKIVKAFEKRAGEVLGDPKRAA